MAYTKQEWNCGDTITADKMNHIEDGIEAASSGGGALFVKYDHREEAGNTITCYFDKTWQEVHDALVAGRVVTANAILQTQTTSNPRDGLMDYITGAMEYNGSYQIRSVLTSTDNARSFEPLSSPSEYLKVVVDKLT